MVKNISKISKTNISISVTGIAGPSGGTRKKPVGLVYVGIKKGNIINIYDVAAYDTDAIIIFDKPGRKISELLLKQPGIKANKKKVSIIKWADDEAPDYVAISDEMDKILEKLSK